MSIRSHLFRASSFVCLVLITVGPVPIHAEDDKSAPRTKPISQNNRSSQSSRYGDRLQQMKSRSSTPSSTSRSSSVSRSSSSRSQSSSSSTRSSSSYSPSTRTNSNSSAVSRSRASSSSSYGRSSSSSSYRRNPGSSSSKSSRSSTVTRPSTSNRSSSAYSRTTRPSSSNSYRRTPSPATSSSLDQSRSSSSTRANNRTRSAVPPTTYNRGSSNASSSSFDRNRSTASSNTYVQSNDRRSSSSYSSRTRTNSVVTPNLYDRNRTGSRSIDRNDRRDTTTSTRSDLNRSSSSATRNRDQSTSGRSYSHSDNNHTTHNRNYGSLSRDRYTHSRNSNHNRNKHMHSGYHNRYVFDFHRYKDSRHYNHDRFIRGAYCPFYDRLYHDSYFKRRYYSPALFSTIILSTGINNSVYDNYAYGNYTTYESMEPYIELYEHSGFRGESLQVFAGEAIYNLKDIRFTNYKSFNDRFSSIKVYGEVTVVLYIDSDFGGDYIYLHGSHIDFGRDSYLRRFNDEISSIEVLPGIIHEMDHRPGSRDYLLNSHLLESSPYQQPPSTSGDIAPAATNPTPVPVTSPVNAVMHADQARVILYDQPNYQGNQVVLTPGDVQVDLLSLSKGLAGTWNDCVASIQIEGNTEIFIYSDREFRGDGIAIRDSVPNMSVDTNLVPFVNRVSSVVVNPGY